VPTAAQKQCFKNGYSFSDLPRIKQQDIWLSIWAQSTVVEVRLQVLMFFQRYSIEELSECLPSLEVMAEGLENWCESDYLSAMLAQLVEYEGERMRPILKSWNRAQSPWLRRQSVVCLFYYQALRDSYVKPTLVFQLVKNLLLHEEHYVQKGVGWTLREALQVYERETYAFIDTHLHQLSATAFSTVMEKASKSKKEAYKKARRLGRLKTDKA